MIRPVLPKAAQCGGPGNTSTATAFITGDSAGNNQKGAYENKVFIPSLDDHRADRFEHITSISCN